MNDCRQIRNQFIPLIEEALSAAKREEAMAHMEGCADCQRLYHHLRQTYRVLDDVHAVDPGLYFYTRVSQRLKNQHVSTGNHIYRILQPIAIGIFTVAGIFAGVLIGQSIAESSINIASSTSNEALGSYASDYYLTGSGEEGLEILVNNE